MVPLEAVQGQSALYSSYRLCVPFRDGLAPCLAGFVRASISAFPDTTNLAHLADLSIPFRRLLIC